MHPMKKQLNRIVCARTQCFSYTQCGDVTSRGVSGRLMRRSSDSGESPERARKPPPSADYHLVRCIWQLGLTECPASFCVAGGERINSLLAYKGDTQIHLPLKMAARQTSILGSNYNGLIAQNPTCAERVSDTTAATPLKHFPSDTVCFSRLRRALLLSQTLFKVRAVIGLAV